MLQTFKKGFYYPMIQNFSAFTSALLILILSSCVSQKMEVVCVCEEGQQKQDTIKWEVFPELEGAVEIFASSSPDFFNLSLPLATANISDRVVLVPKLGDNRKYFMLSFDKKERVYVTNRKINVPGVLNLRDIGGYVNDEGQMIKWGKIYRSGRLSDMTKTGKERLDKLKIKTLIDLCSAEEKAINGREPNFPTVVSIPMKMPLDEQMQHRLLEGKCMRNDAIIYMQDLFSSYTTNYHKELSMLFNVLSKESSYPVLIECGDGNDRTAFVVALIMAALKMPEDQIMDDYLFSNSCLDYMRIADFGVALEPEQQEALTALVSAQSSYLEYSFEKIRQDHQSIDRFFAKKLNLTPRKREKLQQILLTR